MARKLLLDGKRVWLKDYDERGYLRRGWNALGNAIIGAMGAGILRAPPWHVGEAAKTVELRRLRELAAQGVLVPRVLGEGRGTLMLEDLGLTLGHQLRHAADASLADALVGRALAAVADVHDRGGYLGQAFARNMTVSDRGVGFIDFEEDPLEVMPLRDAQARDWLLFVAGLSSFYAGRGAALSDLVVRLRPRIAADVADRVGQVAGRLAFLEPLTRRLWADARAVGMAVATLRGNFGVPE